MPRKGLTSRRLAALRKAWAKNRRSKYKMTKKRRITLKRAQRAAAAANRRRK